MQEYMMTYYISYQQNELLHTKLTKLLNCANFCQKKFMIKEMIG